MDDPTFERKTIEARSNCFHLMELNIISKEENKLFRNRVNALLKKRKIAYFEKLFLSFRQNMKIKLGDSLRR